MLPVGDQTVRAQYAQPLNQTAITTGPWRTVKREPGVVILQLTTDKGTLRSVVT